MIDEELLERVRRRVRKREEGNRKRRDKLLREKAQGLRCQIGDCLGPIRVEFRGGKYCRNHGNNIRSEYGKKNGLCVRCGEADRDGELLKCRKCLDRMNAATKRFDTGAAKSAPLAILTIKRYGREVLL